MEVDMSALELALFHIARGTSYSWDLSTLISFGVPVSDQLRQRVLAGATTFYDAEKIRGSLGVQIKARRMQPRH
jgi:hypothetical protein